MLEPWEHAGTQNFSSFVPVVRAEDVDETVTGGEPETSSPYLFDDHLYLEVMLTAKLTKCGLRVEECGGPLFCPNWHEYAEPADRRRPPQPLSKKPMKFVDCRNPKCTFGDECMYMHSWTEAMHPELYKKGRCKKEHAYGDNLLLCTFKHPEIGDTVAHHTREEACARLLQSWRDRRKQLERQKEQEKVERERKQEEARVALLNAVTGSSGKRKKRRRRKKRGGGRGNTTEDKTIYNGVVSPQCAADKTTGASPAGSVEDKPKGKNQKDDKGCHRVGKLEVSLGNLNLAKDQKETTEETHANQTDKNEVKRKAKEHTTTDALVFLDIFDDGAFSDVVSNAFS